MSLTDPSEVGCEYVVDAFECEPSRLASPGDLAAIVRRLIAELDLHPVGEPMWHVFGSSGGITGLVLLAESHLTVHTFPERGFAAFNLYHCRSAPPWPWEMRLAEYLGAARVVLRTVMRGHGNGSHEALA